MVEGGGGEGEEAQTILLLLLILLLIGGATEAAAANLIFGKKGGLPCLALLHARTRPEIERCMRGGSSLIISFLVAESLGKSLEAGSFCWRGYWWWWW
jgi:hypothetical protein